MTERPGKWRRFLKIVSGAQVREFNRAVCSDCKERASEGTRMSCCCEPICVQCHVTHMTGRMTRDAHIDCPFCGETRDWNDLLVTHYPLQ